MAGFFPSGPATSVYGLILICSVVLCLWHGRREMASVAGAMFVSWIIARTATWLDVLVIQVIGTGLCAWIALSARNQAGLLVSLLFGLKLPFYALHVLNVGPFSSIESMWLASEMIAYIQIVIMSLGGLSNGRYIRIFDRLSMPSRTSSHLLDLLQERLKRLASS